MDRGMSVANMEQETELQVLPAGPQAIVLTNLTDGLHHLRMYDAQGRLVLARALLSHAGRTGEVQLDLSRAFYILQVDGVRTARYIPVR